MKTESDTVELGAFDFECGAEIPSLEVAYEAYGEFDGDNAVLVCHALTGSQNVAGYGTETAGQARAWWNDIVGPGKAIDTNEYYVVCANVPGSCYGTTGPASESPDGEPYGTDFPPVTIGDWTRAQRRLLDELGVGRLHAVVGGSVGGMNALDWVRRYPDDVRYLLAVATAGRLDPQCLALDAIARRSITTDPNWNGGDYYDSEPPDDGLALARQLGHVMYLSKSSMERKFGRRAAGRDARRDSFPADPAASFFAYRDVESYLDYQAEKFVDRFDANSYLYLTRAMDDYDLAEGYEDDADAVAAFEGEALLLSFTGDWHFTTEQAESLAESFRDTSVPVAHHVIESDHGHDAFLVEPEKVGPPVRDFLDAGVAGRSVHDTVEEVEEPSVERDFAPVHSSLFSR
ncbi:homoserine O-acetyltransferase [Halogeometricum borinquense]|uniref:Homoserine O-acetyltransferase n=1 Tax=Halogeometricum borinquense TaxID=60847 RepID=A0A6C0UTN5_9EURY|nr:homoserine O-acetyltransferase [Halogeometricum borinquense]QIB76288.1 homoserine O-acetyltransferase [Halogeometricum borinquense]QIQ75278.1 homoserine O-acetyltransferase [Halogeometricum borinquense]